MSEMVENEERKQAKGKDLKMGGGGGGETGSVEGDPVLGGHWKWETSITEGSQCRSEICMTVVLKETK